MGSVADKEVLDTVRAFCAAHFAAPDAPPLSMQTVFTHTEQVYQHQRARIHTVRALLDLMDEGVVTWNATFDLVRPQEG